MDIWKFDLTIGSPVHPAAGACLMSAVSWFTDGTFNDHPATVCPVLAEFCRWINDGLNHKHRQRLRIFIPRLAGSYDPDHIGDRAEYLARECSERARVTLGKKPRRWRKHQTVAHMEAIISTNALDLMVIYGLAARAGQNPDAIADDVCDILDTALRLGKQGWVYAPRKMRRANATFEQARKPRLAPFDNGRTRNSFWGFDGPDGEP